MIVNSEKAVEGNEMMQDFESEEKNSNLHLNIGL